jgi:8-oxo-dGTP diphosphatase
VLRERSHIIAAGLSGEASGLRTIPMIRTRSRTASRAAVTRRTNRVFQEQFFQVNSRRGTSAGGGMQQGVVVVVRRSGRFLMIRRAAGIVAAGAWCFVGGAIEPGETQHEAVLREFREEVGAPVQPGRKIWEYRGPDGKLLLHWWLATTNATSFRPDPSEVAEVRWCSAAEIRRLPQTLQSNAQFLDEVGWELLDAE